MLTYKDRCEAKIGEEETKVDEKRGGRNKKKAWTKKKLADYGTSKKRPQERKEQKEREQEGCGARTVKETEQKETASGMK